MSAQPTDLRDPSSDPTATYALEPAVVREPHRPARGDHRDQRADVLPLQRAADRHHPAVQRPTDVEEAFRRARRAQEKWARTSIDERQQLLLRLHDLLFDKQAEISDLICWESGKARKDAYDEPLHVALTARYYGRTGHRHLDTTRVAGVVPGLTRVEVNRIPKGVVGIISPWNYPFTLALCDGLPALLAGNAVVHKPDAQTMLTALIGVQLLEEAGFPKDLWQVVAGPGREIGPEIIGRADYVCFTGSTATGKLIAKQCADRLIGCSLELGGKNPILVLRDADVDARRGGRRAGLLLQRRPALRLHGADVRRRPGLRPVRRPVRRPASRRCGSARPGLGQRHGLAHLAAAARRGHRARRGRPRQGRRGCSPAAGRGPTSARTTTSRPSSRASRPTCRASATRPSARSCRSTASTTRPTRSPAPTTGEYGLNASVYTQDGDRGRARRPADQVRHGQHQRGVRRDLRQHRRPDGRHARVRPRPAPGRRGRAALHRDAVRRHPAAAALRPDARAVRRALREGDGRAAAAAQEAGRA